MFDDIDIDTERKKQQTNIIDIIRILISYHHDVMLIIFNEWAKLARAAAMSS